MPEVDGLEATRRLAGEEVPTRVLVLTTFGLDEYVYEGLRADASVSGCQKSGPTCKSAFFGNAHRMLTRHSHLGSRALSDEPQYLELALGQLGQRSHR
jgi:DNA-binding NarL/FixJ family response regulator